MFFSLPVWSQAKAFVPTIPRLRQADQRMMDVMSSVVATGGIVRAFANADELLAAPMGHEMLDAVKELWSAIEVTEATMHDLSRPIHVGFRPGNRRGADHQLTAGRLRRAVGADAYARLELPVMTLYAGNKDTPQTWWAWLLGHYYAAAGGQPPAQE